MTEQEWLSSKDPQAMLKAVSEKISDRKLRLFACGCVRQVWHLLADERSCNAVEVAEKFSDGLATDSERAAARAAAWKAAGGAAWTATGDAAWEAAWAAWDAAWTATGDASWEAARAGRDAARAAARAGRDEAWDTQARLLRDIVGNPFRQHHPPEGSRTCDRCDGFKWVTRGGRVACPDCRGTGRSPCPWLTPTVLSLAHSAYEHRDPATGHLDPVRLAILADALEEAGCPQEVDCRHCDGEGDVKHEDDYGFFRVSCLPCGGDGKMTWRDGGRRGPPVTEDGRKGTGRVPNPILAHLRGRPCPCSFPHPPHVRGCWAIDLILGKE